MNPNDETIYQPVEEQDRSENNEVKEEKVAPKSEKLENKGGGWAKLAIGGVTGIFMGAGAMYAGKPYLDEKTGEWGESLEAWMKENDMEVPEWLGNLIAEHKSSPDKDTTPPQEEGTEESVETLTSPEGTENLTATAVNTDGVHTTTETVTTTAAEPQVTHTSLVPDELHVATVDQNQSFADAFAEARAEVGPGGVFHWHGGVFNTYTEAEWNAMSTAEHNQFAQQAAPEVQHSLQYHEDIVQGPASEPSEEPVIGIEEPESEVTLEPDPEEIDVVINVGLESEHDSDVHILGVSQIENEDGNVMTGGYSVIDGEPVILIDGDNNGVFDVSISDQNHDGEISDNEVVDISDQGLSVEEFAAMAMEQDNTPDGVNHPEGQTDSPQDYLAQDMPDYTNDADTSVLYEA